MNRQSDLAQIQQDFNALRDSLLSLQLATIDAEGRPEASYAPFVWFEQAYYLYLSALARHTMNLNLNPALSILLIESEQAAANPFSRRRIILQAEVEKISRQASAFTEVLDAFRHRFGGFIDVIEPLQDFQLFKILPTQGRFIRGFAQAYELSGEGLNQIRHINPGAGKAQAKKPKR